jgi:murein DD-endopeptidase MepM/ murein hydrolase activator NlpD
MRKISIRVLNRKKESNRLFLIFFIFFLFLLFLFLSFIRKKETPQEEKKEKTEISIADPPLPLPVREDKIIAKTGVTLTDILSPYNFSPLEIHKLREEVKPIYDLAKIKAGHELRVFSDPDENVVSLEYDMDGDSYIHVQKTEGGYQAETRKIPYEILVRMIWGAIGDNLISAVARQDETDILALSLAEIFAWDIDFYTDLREGDTFKIIFEKRYLGGKLVGYGNILAAEFTNQGKTFQAFRYTYPDDGDMDYFDPEGNSLRKEFLKSPIKFARITSRFSLNRLHPIRKVYRPHYGVDYAARVGTPVQATADGTVTYVGWNGTSGRMIRIRHKNAYETMYLHLRSYAKGVRKGAKVEGGQVIGYVGSSGESTGPHLDYRIKYRGSYINPLGWRFKPVKPLREEFSEDFKKEAKAYCSLLDAPLVLFSKCSSFPLYLSDYFFLLPLPE